MLKAPPLKSSVLHYLVLQNILDRGLLICSKIYSKSSEISKKVDNAIFRSDNDIIILINVGSRT